jgi:hypothetical protein
MMNDGQFADSDPNPNPNAYPNGYAKQEGYPNPDPYQYGNAQNSGGSTASNAGLPSYTIAPPPPDLPDYRTLEQSQFQRIQNDRRNGHSRLGLSLLLLVLLLLIAIGAGSFFFLSRQHSTVQTHNTPSNTTSSNPQSNSNTTTNQNGQTTLTVTTHPIIVIENDKGSIRVHAGAASNKVILQATNSTNSSAAIPYTETSDLSTIIIYLSPSNGPDVDVTVPVTSDLKLYTNESNITVSGVKGQMDLNANSGTITVTYSTITTASVLNDNSGAINATQDILNGNVTLINNSGAITFTGSVGATGNYRFTGNGGPVNVTLPRNGSFRIDATANNSTVNANFPGAPVQNGEVHANIGRSPHATVTVSNNGGTVSLHAG